MQEKQQKVSAHLLRGLVSGDGVVAKVCVNAGTAREVNYHFHILNAPNFFRYSLDTLNLKKLQTD